MERCIPPTFQANNIKSGLYCKVFINFAGIPPKILFAGISLFTTAPAATIEFPPTVTPGNIVAPAPYPDAETGTYAGKLE